MLNDFLRSATMTVPIDEVTLQKFLQKRITALSDVTVHIQGEQMKVTGMRKIGVGFLSKSVPVSLTLVPKEAQQRRIVFSVVKVEPADKEVLNGRFLNHPPYVTYESRELTIDFSTLGPLQKIKVGNIKALAFEEGLALLTVGV